LTQADIANAYQLHRAEMRSIFRHGKVPGQHAEDRVLILHLNFRPQRQPDNLRQVLYNMSAALIEPIIASVSPSKQSSLTNTLLKAATQILTETDQNSTTYKYYGGGSPIFQSLLLYAMRPNPKAATRLDTILDETIPRDFVSANSLGLPIRGMFGSQFLFFVSLPTKLTFNYGLFFPASDKCGTESECLSSEQYFTAAGELWIDNQKHKDQPTNETGWTNIIVTSESKEVVQSISKRDFASNTALGNNLFNNMRLITNSRDISQNTGYFGDIHSKILGFSPDEAMISAMSSLKAQLSTRIALGNCCSNFHLLMKDLFDMGCGAFDDKDSFQCLQDHKNPDFRVCCAWDKSEQCIARRSLHNSTIRR
jgi:hypothetical protein